MTPEEISQYVTNALHHFGDEMVEPRSPRVDSIRTFDEDGIVGANTDEGLVVEFDSGVKFHLTIIEQEE